MTADDYRPKARRDGLLVRKVGDEVVVYDRDSDTSHLLNEAMRAVWDLCDGSRTVDDIAARVEGGEEAVRLALGDLETVGLLLQPAASAPTGMSRRRLLKTLAAGAVAIPVVVTLSAQPAAASHIRCQDFNCVTQATGAHTCTTVCGTNKSVCCTSGRDAGTCVGQVSNCRA